MTVPASRIDPPAITAEEMATFEANFPHMAFPRSDTRCMILPAGDVTWRELFVQTFPNIKLRDNKKFSGTFVDVNRALIPRGRHRFFSLSLPARTLLLDGGGSMIWPDLNELCSAYSRLNQCSVVWLQPYDAAYCRYPALTIWDRGTLVRNHAPGLREKYEAYLRKEYVSKIQFDEIIERHRSIGDPLPCEEKPDALSILAYFGWTREVFSQSGWQSVTTSFD